jgi:hypothetical protein
MGTYESIILMEKKKPKTIFKAIVTNVLNNF